MREVKNSHESEVSLVSQRIMQGYAHDIAMSDVQFDNFWNNLMQRYRGDDEKLKQVSESLIKAESEFLEAEGARSKELQALRKIFLQNWFLLEAGK